VAPDRVALAFDDERLVADAGIVLPATLAARIGIEELVDRRSSSESAPARRTRAPR
jgi:hypothetical protein